MTSSLPPFPVDGPVLPEARQIGRTEVIDRLERRIVEQAGHQWLVGPRRTGKTSVAKAALDRLRSAGHIGLEVDVSARRLASAGDLAAELANLGRAAGVGGARAKARLAGGVLRRKESIEVAERVLAVLGADDAAAAVAATGALFGAAEEAAPDLEQVLAALAAHAAIADERVAVLLDEVHRLATLGADGAVANAARWGQDGLVFVLAGSEESAVEKLRTDGPLRSIGQELELPAIAAVDWMDGLRERFEQLGTAIDNAEIYAIIEATDGHPRRTMLVCSYVLDGAASGPADGEVVADAIRRATKDRSWD
jgi:hypothetical protein